MDDPTTAYAQDVVAGKVTAGRLVRLACTRHLRDLEDGQGRGLRWDPDAAARVFRFIGRLRLPSALRNDGMPFHLQTFQQFILGNLFGWKGEDGFRRFRTAYVEQGKGNGKTPLAAAVGLYGLIADGEPAAEIYAAAVTREQASILFRDARLMALASVQTSRELAGILDIGQHNIACLPRGGFFRTISSEHRGLDGKRPQMGLIDEIHEHPTALVVDKMRAGTKARRQALIFEITNSGYDRQSVCWDHHEYSRKILEGSLQDDSWFAYVCTLDPCAKHLQEGHHQPVDGCAECDNWRDELVWFKANPGLGTILPAKYLREQVREAVGMPRKEGIVKRLNFCVWTRNITSWLPAALWSGAARTIDPDTLRGKRCWAGLDLANRFDVNAFVLLFREDVSARDNLTPEQRQEHGKPKTSAAIRLLPLFWIPRECALQREQDDKVPYTLWERQGHIRFTEGNVSDYNAIEADIQALSLEYQIEVVAYDPYNATQMAVSLDAFGVKMEEFPQNMRNFNEPTKEFEALLRVGRLLHNGNPVLDWMASNASVVTDRSASIRPVKPPHGDHKKVDGIVAAVMGLAKAMLSTEGDENWYTPGCLTS